jgi:uncharacterized RDD family membrane protein YckC
MFCLNCGRRNDGRAAFCQSCGSGLQLKTGSAAVPAAQYAGFWMRFLAAVIDCVVLVVGTGVLFVVSFGSLGVAGFAVAWLYEAFLVSSEWQATLGKRVLNIVVTDMNGGRISFARATARHFAKYVSGFILFVGYIMAAFTERKQALHDLMAETLVIQR